MDTPQGSITCDTGHLRAFNNDFNGRLYLQAMSFCHQTKVRAERRIGELLIQQRESDGRQSRGGDRKSKLHNETLIPTLADLGIEKTQSKRWQDIAGYLPLDFTRSRFTSTSDLNGSGL